MFQRNKQGSSDLDTNKYTIKQKLLSLNDDYWIKNSQGEKEFKVNTKLLKIRQTIVFEDLNGQELCHIQERSLRLRETMEIEDPQGKQIAVIKKKALSVMGQDSWSVKVKGDRNLHVDGKILDHEYTITAGREKVAEVSKKLVSLTDSYEVEIKPGEDDILILAVVICIDQMASN